MASSALNLPSRPALVSICCAVLVFVVFTQVPWQKVLIKRINTDQNVHQILEPHKEYSDQSQGKSASREDKMKREGSVMVSPVPIGHINVADGKFQGQERFKLTEKYQAGLRDSPDDFWNMNYEERSKVST